MNSLKKAIEKYNGFPIQVRASLWFLLCSFLQNGISLITTPIFTRLLSTSEYGQYNIFDLWLRIVTAFVSLHLDVGDYPQGLVKFSDDRKRFSSSIQGLTLALAAGWTVVYLAFHSFWNSLFRLTTIQMLAMLVMIWSTASFNLWAGEKRVEYRYHKLVIATLLISIAKPIVGIILVILATDKVTARILGLAIVEFVGYLGFFIVQMKRGKQFYSAKYWKRALIFNIPLIPHYLSQTVLNSADRIMISNMIGDGEAGIYSLGYSISLIMTIFNMAITSTLTPWIYQKLKAGRPRDISKTGYLAIGVLAFVTLGIISVAPEIVAIFAPVAYHNAIWIIPPVAMSVLFIFSYDIFAKFEFYFEKTKFTMISSMIGAVLNVSLNYLFIKHYGYYAAGYTTFVCYLLIALSHYIYMRRICNQYLNGEKIFNVRILCVIYAAFIIGGFALMMTYNFPVLRYSVIAATFVAMFLFRNKILEIVSFFVKIRQERKRF